VEIPCGVVLYTGLIHFFGLRAYWEVRELAAEQLGFKALMRLARSTA